MEIRESKKRNDAPISSPKDVSVTPKDAVAAKAKESSSSIILDEAALIKRKLLVQMGKEQFDLLTEKNNLSPILDDVKSVKQENTEACPTERDPVSDEFNKESSVELKHAGNISKESASVVSPETSKDTATLCAKEIILPKSGSPLFMTDSNSMYPDKLCLNHSSGEEQMHSEERTNLGLLQQTGSEPLGPLVISCSQIFQIAVSSENISSPLKEAGTQARSKKSNDKLRLHSTSPTSQEPLATKKPHRKKSKEQAQSKSPLPTPSRTPSAKSTSKTVSLPKDFPTPISPNRVHLPNGKESSQNTTQPSSSQPKLRIGKVKDKSRHSHRHSSTTNELPLTLRRLFTEMARETARQSSLKEPEIQARTKKLLPGKRSEKVKSEKKQQLP